MSEGKLPCMSLKLENGMDDESANDGIIPPLNLN